MSIQVMTAVWRKAPYEGGALLVLLAMADWADDNGNCWPSVRTLAEKSRQSERNVRKCLARMKRDGTVSIEVNAGPHFANRYRIQFGKFENSRNRAEQNSGLKNVQDENYDAKPLALVPVGEERSSSNTSIDTSGEPSISALREVFNYYLAILNKNPKTYELTPLRKRKGLTRLRECLDKTGGDLSKAVKLMKIAVDNLAASDWHMGRDPKTNGKRYCEWEDHLFSSYERMEKWWNYEKG